MLSGTDVLTNVATSTVTNAIIPTQPANQPALAQGAGSPAFFNLMNSWQGTVMLAAVAVIIGTAVGAGFGIKWLITRYRDSVEQELLDKVDLIEELRHTHLTGIPVKGKKTPISLPPVIEKVKKIVNIKGKDKEIIDLDAIHFPDSILRQKGRRIPQQTSLGLAAFKECIYNGIANLLFYYFFVTPESANIQNAEKANVRKEEGITRAVISYLVEILVEHCLNFQGFDYDIAVLNALINFIEEYSQKRTLSENRDFSFLNKVTPWLKQAVKLLEIHQGMLNLQEIISEVFSTCRDFSDHLIKYIAMLINDPLYRENMEFLIKDTIQQGKIGLHYVKKSFWGHDFHLDEINIYESPFKKSLMEQSQFAIKVIDIKQTLTEEEIPLVKPQIPDLRRLEYLKQMNTKGLSDEQKKLRQKGIEQIESLIADYEKTFATANNFMMTELISLPNKDPDFYPITAKKPELLVKRVEGIWNFLILDNEINFVQSLMGSIYNGLGMLGELCITSKENLQVLDVADAGFKNVLKTVTKITNHFDLIDQEGRYLNAQIKDDKKTSEWQFRTGIKNELDEIKMFMESVKIRIDNYWTRNSELNDELRELAKDNLKNATEMIGKRFGVEMKIKVQTEKILPPITINNYATSIFDNAIKLDSARNKTIRAIKADHRKDVARIDWEKKSVPEPSKQVSEKKLSRKNRRKSDGRPLKSKDEISREVKIQDEMNIDSANNVIPVKEKRDKKKSVFHGIFGSRESKTEKTGRELDIVRKNSYDIVKQGAVKKILPFSLNPMNFAISMVKKEPLALTVMKSNANADSQQKKGKDKKKKSEKRKSQKSETASASTQSIVEDNPLKIEEATIASDEGENENEQNNNGSAKLFKHPHHQDSSLNLLKASAGHSESEDDYESPEAHLAKFNSDAYTRADKLKVKLDKMDEKIIDLADCDQAERDAYFKIHAALMSDFEKIKELLKELERSERRNGKIKEMLDVLESVIPLVSDFLRIKDKQGRKDHVANMINQINEKIPKWPLATFIDRYKPGLIFDRPVFSLFCYPTCREKLNDITSSCDNLRSVFDLQDNLIVSI